MLRRHRQIKKQIEQPLDACIFALSFWFAYVLRAAPSIEDFFRLQQVGKPFETYYWLWFVVILASPVILEAQGYYDRPLVAPRRSVLLPLFKGCLFSAIGVVLLLFLFKLELARSVAILFGSISFALVFAKEELVRLGLKSRFARAQLERKFILVGTLEETARMRAELNARPEEGMAVVAELDLGGKSMEELAHLLHEHSVNGVIFSAKHTYFEQVEAAIKTCELEGVETWLVADFFKTQISHTSLDEFQGHPVLVFRSTPEASWESVLKQVFDVVTAFVLVIVVCSWLFPLIALAIKLTSRGPVLFRQRRAGLNGEPFTIYKFRTMETNAEQRQHELAARNEMSGPVFKITNDPRITRVGRFLRKFSLDELPQIFNVLRGEMSLVGPRPLPVDEVKRFDDVAHRRRLSVRPGLTCLWQISGRNNVCDFDEWVRLDLSYIDNWSFWLDMKILWRTIPIVLMGTGAK
ncbi:MAG TPA: sugar transferase [Verrucomicrobiae bacterium]|nr:sugar transferase [Verrucomicrobiae bacterium]